MTVKERMQKEEKDRQSKRYVATVYINATGTQTNFYRNCLDRILKDVQEQVNDLFADDFEAVIIDRRANKVVKQF